MEAGSVRPIFDNGATRARARAWGTWMLFAGACGAAWALQPCRSAAAEIAALAALAGGSALILVRPQPRKIPVLNYHSVSADPEWMRIGPRVSLPPEAFERQLLYLKRHGYQTLFVSELCDLLADGNRATGTEKHVALTFDDGYADNWIAVFPLLRRHGMKATLFVATDFIADATACRPTAEESQGRSVDWSGYLTWPELQAMQASGLVEVQPHGRSHARVFARPHLRGFVGPGKPNLWLFWNMCPELRPRWWRELERDRSLWGQPVFAQAPALAERAYRPNTAAVQNLRAWVTEQGTALFEQSDWEERLRERWARAEAHAGSGTFESDVEYERRVAEEIGGARAALAIRLGAKADVLCWPENAFSEAGERLARRAGCRATVSNRHDSRNMPGEAPDRLVRVFIGSHALGFPHPFWDFAAFVLELKVFEGRYVWYPWLAVMHLVKKAVSIAGRRCQCPQDYLSIWE